MDKLGSFRICNKANIEHFPKQTFVLSVRGEGFQAVHERSKQRTDILKNERLQTNKENMSCAQPVALSLDNEWPSDANTHVTKLWPIFGESMFLPD